MATVVLVLYGVTLLGLAYFALHRLKMLWLYARGMRRTTSTPPAFSAAEAPAVCVQCPLFNEPLVVEQLLEKVTEIAWPGKLEIQILDDSTDQTPAIIQSWLKAHPERAANVRHLRREHRTGYKAGALGYGMNLSDARFFAIFDADFRPESDFLQRLMPHFRDDRVAVVQARWEFSNRRASLLTRFQGIFLDAHFIVEQVARSAAGLFFNFNGTAGIWRREALEDAGSWTPDTVTEDLDASYRAQRRGWRFVYVRDYTVASELPENLTAFKSQQHRWTKGGIQVARKQLGEILRSDLPGRIKRESFSHLTIGFVHPLLVTFSILFVPYLYLMGQNPMKGAWLFLNPISLILTGGTTVVLYVISQYFFQKQFKEGLLLLVTAPLMLAFGLAMSVTCCVAVLEGLFSDGGEFVRTPKGGRHARASSLLAPLRGKALFTAVIAMELIIGLCLLAGALYFGRRDMMTVSCTLLVKSIGFLGVAAVSTSDLFPRSEVARA
ncbi:MAG TPA: glycosyltransferase [Opitutaceae bacterium]|nr:glycosyltransferase [Opitutaceae bacterium]